VLVVDDSARFRRRVAHATRFTYSMVAGSDHVNYMDHGRSTIDYTRHGRLGLVSAGAEGSTRPVLGLQARPAHGGHVEYGGLARRREAARA
jgi:hypothetical protein